MALLERVSTLVRANLNDLIDKAEHPEKMIKQVILDLHTLSQETREGWGTWCLFIVAGEGGQAPFTVRRVLISEGARRTIAFMWYGAPPQVENRWVAIAADTQLVLASVLSSYFSEEGSISRFATSPRFDVPYSPSSDFGRDGYFARVIGGP